MISASTEHDVTAGQLDIITVDTAETLHGLFRQRVARTPDSIAYRQYDTGERVWKAYSWTQLADMLENWQIAFHNEGLAAGDRVAILLPNSIEWVCCEQAALSLGLVVVPLYTTDTADNIAYILEDAGARVLILPSPEQWQPLSVHILPELVRVVSLRAVEGDMLSDSRLCAASIWLKQSASTDITDYTANNGSDTLATIVYTSGTTGRAKGVMLSHRNILWNAHAVLEAMPAYRDDVFLSFLPLSHTFERTVGYYLPMMAGCCVAYARSVKTLADDLISIRPTVLISVPRIYERVYAKIQQTLADKGWLAQQLLVRTVAFGWCQFAAEQGRGPALTPIQRCVWSVLRRLLAAKILARFGGRIRVAVSGGAPLTKSISRFFIGLGLPLLQGYGMTESSPVVSANRSSDNVPDSVGRLLTGVDITLGEQNELLVRSPGVMLGYWRQAHATGEAIDAQGWLHTGDVAELIDDHLYIRGRTKDIVVMSTGEKAPPADLELAITVDPLFEQAMVVGEGRPYLAALLVLDPAVWQQFAAQFALCADDPASLRDSNVHKAVLARIAVQLSAFPYYAQVRAVFLTLDPWTIDNGLVTPTLKQKRAAIEQQFANEIHHLYAGHVLS